MALIEEIQSALKSKKVILGYRESIRFIKANSPKMIVIANNIPDEMKDEIEHTAKLSNTVVKMFEGSSKELGVICGKPFPIAILVIKS